MSRSEREDLSVCIVSDMSIKKYVNERRVTQSDFKINAFKIINVKLIEAIKAVSDSVEI